MVGLWRGTLGRILNEISSILFRCHISFSRAAAARSVPHMVRLDGGRMNYLIGFLFLYFAWGDFRNMLDPNRLSRRAVQFQSGTLMLFALFIAYAFIFHGAPTSP